MINQCKTNDKSVIKYTQFTSGDHVLIGREAFLDLGADARHRYDVGEVEVS